MRFPDAMTLDAARTLFFARAQLGSDGGYGARWVRVGTRPFAVYFPNTRCRAANLYASGFPEHRLAAVTVGALRSGLGVTTEQPHPGWADVRAFLGWIAA